MRSRGVLVCLCLVLSCFTIEHINAAKKVKKLKITTEVKSDDCSTVAEPGDTLVVHYTGSLENGQVFDSSLQREPLPVTLGAGQVIKGWDEGLVGMCQGEVRKLVIPPHLGYGDAGAQNVIPGGATLLFTVELIELQKKPLMKLPSSQFWFYLGIIGVVVLIGYELYKKGANKDGEKAKGGSGAPAKKKGSKKRKSQ